MLRFSPIGIIGQLRDNASILRIIAHLCELADEAAVPVPHQCQIDRLAGTEIGETVGPKDLARLWD